MARRQRRGHLYYRRMRDGRHVGYIGAITMPTTRSTRRHTVYGKTRADVRQKMRNARDRLRRRSGDHGLNADACRLAGALASHDARGIRSRSRAFLIFWRTSARVCRTPCVASSDGVVGIG